MRDPLHWLSVKHKLTLLFGGLCVLAFGVGGYLVSRSARGALEAEIRTRLEFQIRAYATALDSYLLMLTRRVEDFASDGYIRSHVLRISAADEPTRTSALRQELERHLVVNKRPLVPEFDALTVLDTTGASVLSDAIAPDIARFYAAREHDESIWFSGIEGTLGGSPSLLIGAPLFGFGDRTNSGPTIGRLIVRVRPEAWIIGALQSIRAEKPNDGIDARLHLIDSIGRALVVPVGPSPSPATVVLRQADGARLSMDRVHSPIRGVYSRGFPIAATGWSIRVDLHAERILDAISGLQSRLLGFGVVLAGIAMLLLYFPMRYIARPLVVLKDAARRIRDGDLEARVAVDSEDEIGELAQSFNSMAEALQDRAREVRQKQLEIHEEHERLAAVIASMRDGLVVLDRAGSVVLSNASAKPFLDHFDRTGGLPHHKCKLHRSSSPECERCLFGSEQAPRSCVLDVGALVWEVHTAPLRTADGAAGRVLVVIDISDRVDQDDRQIHQERLAVLGEVAAVMAHELNNPLTSISMFNQMLASELPSDSPLRHNVEVIQRNTTTCKQAIRELLDYATGAEPELSSIDVHDILEDVARFLTPVSAKCDIEITCTFDAATPTISGDEVQIRQVFVNLTMNAVQAIGRGGRVELHTRAIDDQLAIDVIDSGPGMEPDVADKIFRPFFTSKPRGAGTGLGLPTARRIAELHGGSLELVASGPGRTVFRVRLRAEPTADVVRGEG